MENLIGSTFTEYPELVGKNLKNVQKTDISLFFEFTDGSTFLASPKPLPGAKYTDFSGPQGSVFDDSPIVQADFVSSEPWNDMKEPEADSVIIACGFTISTVTKHHVFNFTAYTSASNVVTLDTKYTPASTN